MDRPKTTGPGEPEVVRMHDQPSRRHPPAGRDRAKVEEIVTPLADAPDIELIRRIAATGGRKYTAGNIDRRKYQRLVALGWLTEVSVNISDVLYEVTDTGNAAALQDD
jgi:hypothetical protein